MKDYVASDLRGVRRRTLLHLARKANLLDMPPNEVFVPFSSVPPPCRRPLQATRGDNALFSISGLIFLGGLGLLWMSFR